MEISKELAIKILKYLDEHKDFYFPFLIICKENDDSSGIEPMDWKKIKNNRKYQTFELEENLQNLYEETVRLMAKGFIEKITESDNTKLIGRKSVTFSITKEEIEGIFKETIGSGELKNNKRLNSEKIGKILDFVECDEMLAKDIRMSIKSSILEVLSN